MAASAPVRPLRPSRRWVPTVSGRRCGDPLLAPAAGEVQDLAGHRRDREGEHAVVQRVRVVAGVGQLGLGPEQSPGGRARADQVEPEPGDLVDRVDLERRRRRRWQRRAAVGSTDRPSPSTRSAVVVNFGDQSRPGAGAADAGPPHPAGPVLGQQRQPDRLVDDVGRDRAHAGSVISAAASAAVRSPRSAPQCTMAGSRPRSGRARG